MGASVEEAQKKEVERVTAVIQEDVVVLMCGANPPQGNEPMELDGEVMELGNLKKLGEEEFEALLVSPEVEVTKEAANVVEEDVILLDFAEEEEEQAKDGRKGEKGREAPVRESVQKKRMWKEDHHW